MPESGTDAPSSVEEAATSEIVGVDAPAKPLDAQKSGGEAARPVAQTSEPTIRNGGTERPTYGHIARGANSLPTPPLPQRPPGIPTGEAPKQHRGHPENSEVAADDDMPEVDPTLSAALGDMFAVPPKNDRDELQPATAPTLDDVRPRAELGPDTGDHETIPDDGFGPSPDLGSPDPAPVARPQLSGRLADFADATDASDDLPPASSSDIDNTQRNTSLDDEAAPAVAVTVASEPVPPPASDLLPPPGALRATPAATEVDRRRSVPVTARPSYIGPDAAAAVVDEGNYERPDDIAPDPSRNRSHIDTRSDIPFATDFTEASAPLAGDVTRRRGQHVNAALGRRRALMNAGWFALATIVGSTVGLVWAARETVVTTIPGTAKLYAAIGQPVNTRGLDFQDIAYRWSNDGDGRPELQVTGKIRNISNRVRDVPTVVFVLIDARGDELYNWARTVRKQPLDAGAEAPFTARVPAPPGTAHQLRVRFAHRAR